MSPRSVAAVAIVATLATIPACVCQPETPCTQNTTTNTVVVHDDHTGEMLMIGVVGVALLLGLVAIAKSSSHEATKQAPPPFAPRAAAPSTMVFAPMPEVEEEGEQLRLQRMYVQGQVLAHAGRCDGALALGRQIARSSPRYFAIYASEPSIAACITATSRML